MPRSVREQRAAKRRRASGQYARDMLFNEAVRRACPPEYVEPLFLKVPYLQNGALQLAINRLKGLGLSLDPAKAAMGSFSEAAARIRIASLPLPPLFPLILDDDE